MPISLTVIMRSTVSFFALLVFVRLMGKQQVSQITHFDYVVGITIGSIAATLSVQVNENSVSTFVGMLTWTILAILIAILGVKSSWVHGLVGGKATVVVENGKILEKNLKKIRIPTEELISQLRTKGVFNMTDVEFALFEPGGKISVQKKSQEQPLKPSDLNISTQYEGLPATLIMDGSIVSESLQSLNLSKAWLYHQLSKQNIQGADKVSLAQLDTKGNLYVDLKGNKLYYIIPTDD